MYFYRVKVLPIEMDKVAKSITDATKEIPIGC